MGLYTVPSSLFSTNIVVRVPGSASGLEATNLTLIILLGSFFFSSVFFPISSTGDTEHAAVAAITTTGRIIFQNDMAASSLIIKRIIYIAGVN